MNIVDSKMFRFAAALTVLHAIILYNSFNGHFPLVEGIYWNSRMENPVLMYPFDVSRAWDVLIIPSAYFFLYFVERSKWWDTWKDNGDAGWMHGTVLCFVGFIALIYSYGVAGGILEGGKPAMDELLTLIQVVGVWCVVVWIILTLCDAKFLTCVYSFCLSWVCAGITASFFAGFPVFVMLAVIPSLVAIFAINFLPLSGWSKPKQALLSLIAFLKKLFEKVKKEKTILDKVTAPSLNVTPNTKKKIAEAVQEIRDIEKKITENRKLAEECQPLINSLAVGYQKEIAKEQSMAASANEFLRASATEYAESAESLLKQKQVLLGRKIDHYSVVSELEERRALLYSKLEGIESDAQLCVAIDKDTKEGFGTQKKVTDFLKKEGSANK